MVRFRSGISGDQWGMATRARHIGFVLPLAASLNFPVAPFLVLWYSFSEHPRNRLNRWAHHFYLEDHPILQVAGNWAWDAAQVSLPIYKGSSTKWPLPDAWLNHPSADFEADGCWWTCRLLPISWTTDEIAPDQGRVCLSGSTSRMQAPWLGDASFSSTTFSQQTKPPLIFGGWFFVIAGG